MTISTSAATVPQVPNQNINYDTTSGPSTPTKISSTHTLDLLSVQVDDDADTSKQFKDDNYRDGIKRNLVAKLAEMMLTDNRIEFTQQLDPIHNRRIFRAYTYVGTKQVISVIKDHKQLNEKDVESVIQYLLDSGSVIPRQYVIQIIREVEKRLNNK